MITDQLAVFFDNAAAAANMTSNVVSFMPYAGREDPIYVTFLAAGATGGLVYNISFEHSDDNTTFTPVKVAGIEKPDAAPILKTIRLPIDVTGKYVRLSVAITGGTPAAGDTLFAGVTRDHFAPYDKGMYIDDGKVVA